MADFEIAYGKTARNEAGYGHDPQDKGGETFNGISRVYHPRWPGWQIIDEAKKCSNFPACLVKDQAIREKLAEMEKVFYCMEFWGPVKGDDIEDQDLANALYDMAVNGGISPAVKMLQKALNILNRNQSPKFYPDIAVDGEMGPKTLATLNTSARLNTFRRIFNVFNLYRGKFYLEAMEKDPVNEKYIGWFDRIEFKEIST